MKKIFCLITVSLLSIFLSGMNSSTVQANSLSTSAQMNVSESLIPFVVVPSDAYDYFIRGMAPQADIVSSSGNLTTDTSVVVFDSMQLASYDEVVIKDMSNSVVASQPLPDKLQLNRITFSNLKGKLKAGQIYSFRVTSSEGARELPLFLILPVES